MKIQRSHHRFKARTPNGVPGSPAFKRLVLCRKYCFILIQTFLLLAGAFTCNPAISQNKIALVIGNATYKDSPLRNPVNDANAFAASLRAVGFTVIVKNNLNKTEMENAVRNYSQRLTAGDVALLYYSGHGMQVKGVNYLVPVGESIYSEVDIPYKSMEAQFVIDYMQEAKTSVNIIILDACRDNPFKSFRSLSRGFVPVIAPQGTFIAYSTAPGTVAFDGAGTHSPYTENLIAAMEKPGIPIEEMFKEVRRNVMNETSKMQVPWESSSLIDAFAFNGAVKDKEPDRKLPDFASWIPAMVSIPGGTFLMGSNDGEDDEKPVHRVTVSGFSMGKYEVTVSQFKKFIDETGHRTDADKDGGSYMWTGSEWEKRAGVTWRCDAEGNARPQNEYDHPVIHVSWNDAVEYCRWLSGKTGNTYRLPTEAEWEYAAGNGAKHTRYSWGNGEPWGKNGGNVADEAAKRKFSGWTIFSGYDDGYVFTSPVGTYNPNEFGLYDMTGNVWEWCSDWYGAQYYQGSPASNPEVPSSGSNRVNRGGGWDNDPRSCRTSNRSDDTPDKRYDSMGFRLVFVP